MRMAPRINTFDLSDEQLRRVLELRRERAAITDELDRILGSVSEVDRPSWGPCKRCGYTWKGLWRNKKPKHCAKCHAPNWDRAALAPVRRVSQRVVVPAGLTPPPSLSTHEFSRSWGAMSTEPQPESYSKPTLSTEMESDASRSANSAELPIRESTSVLEATSSGQATDGADQDPNEPVPTLMEQYEKMVEHAPPVEFTLEEMQARCPHPPYKILDGICIGCGKEFPRESNPPDIQT